MIVLDKFYIDGGWTKPLQRQMGDVIGPASEAVVAQVALGTAADVDHAVQAARRAFDPWSRRDPTDRIALVMRLREIYQRRADEMAAAISTELGAPIDFAREAQVAAGLWHIDGFLEAMQSHHAEQPLHPGEDGETIIQEPVGVCGLITPWNWPMNQITLKVIPALLVGCTVILKPSEIAPLSAHLFAEMIDEAGFPPGSFNLVHGDGAGVGAPLSAHPGVDLISFTGSTRAGVAVATAAVPTMKRVTLELGGKSPNLIFADCDVVSAVAAGVRLCMENTGQSCSAPTRMLVERSVYDQAIRVAAETADALIVGQPDQPGVHLGPVISARQFAGIQQMIQTGIDEGARLVAGGTGKPKGFETGYFIRPTIFADVDNDMAVAREEIFGPVLVLIPFETEDEAVRLANDMPYGLAAYLSTADPKRAARVARQLRAGMVSVNGADFAKGSPFGGYKMSGIGREGGRFGLEDFLEIKTIAQPAKRAAGH